MHRITTTKRWLLGSAATRMFLGGAAVQMFLGSEAVRMFFGGAAALMFFGGAAALTLLGGAAVHRCDHDRISDRLQPLRQRPSATGAPFKPDFGLSGDVTDAEVAGSRAFFAR